MSSLSFKSIVRSKSQPETGYLTICCGRAFLSEVSYNFHVGQQEEHSASTWSDVLLKTPIVKITQLPHSISQKLLSRKNQDRIASLKHRMLSHRSSRTIRCQLCGLLIFGGNLKRHIRTAHSMKSQHQCRWCSCAYGTRKAILYHISRTHPMEQRRFNWNAAAQINFERALLMKAKEKSKNAEKDNNYTETSTQEIRSDTRKKWKDRPKVHECIFCGQIFDSILSFQQHLLVHIGDKPYKCEVCKYDFGTTNELSEHIDLWHPGCLPFKCDKCPGLFYSLKEQLDNHNKLRHSSVAVSDSINLRKENEENLDDGFYKDTSKEKEHQVYNGDTNLKVADLLKMKSLKVPEGYKCKLCGKVFKAIAYYRTHRLLHTDIFPYECSKCHRKFRTKHNCRSHQETSHVVNGEYKCQLCPCTFASSHSLMSHTGIYHNKRDKRGQKWGVNNRGLPKKQLIRGIYSKKVETVKKQLYRKNNFVPTNKEKEDGYECHICRKTLFTAFGFKGHMLIHTNERPHKCQKCPAKFRLVSTRDRHIKTNHVEGGSFQCCFCPCTFSLARGLRRHLYCYHSGRRNTDLKAQIQKRKTISLTFKKPEKEKEDLEDLEDYPMEKEDIEIKTNAYSQAEDESYIKMQKPSKKTISQDVVKIDSEDLNNIDAIQMENGFMCSLCGKILKSFHCFRAHRLVHSNSFPFKCPKCAKKFRRRVDREKHLRVSHVANGGFKCPQCPCTFSALKSLKSHSTSEHRVRVTE